MAPSSTAYTLTKSTFLAGAQCHKRLWWTTHEPAAPELRHDVATKFRLDQGIEVGILARRYVPGGVLIERGGRSLDAMLAESARALHDTRTSVIYEAGVIAHDTLVFADILVRAEGGFTLIEVKGVTSVVEQHLRDVTLQTCVLRAAGVAVTRCEVMHLNRECRYPDLSTLFVREDVTEEVERRLAAVPAEIDAQCAVLADGLPQVAIGPQCTEPEECPFLDRCHPALPPHHVSTLHNIRRARAAAYEAKGWHTVHDLPDSLELGAIMARQRRSVREGRIVVERDGLVRALRQLVPPVAHIDFETVQLAIPRWPGCRPFDQVPVQLSCHVVDEHGRVTHHAWLADGPDDPRPAIGRAIVDACAGARTVTAYNASFERTCMRGIGEAYPQLAEPLAAIAGRMVDLLPLVRDHVYHPEFRGSFSLKAVLPALVPELSYRDLEITNGAAAAAELARMLFSTTPMGARERSAIRNALLAYCQRDTDAMVALANRLVELAGESPPPSAPRDPSS